MSKKVTKSDLESTIEKLQAENTALRQRMVSSEANAKLTLKERDEQSASIASLKTELMAKCLEVAKLEGYITRANESDPEPASPTIRTFGAIERPPMTSVSYGANWSEPQTPWWNR
ncbi:hypothetical protein [Mesorhizobium sp. M1B.F.Ca.ET.045.04.1.1]|uniref:hypothetical protein n=1 Tax=Mesorhizobium sp. M1B.F.Ca.ET.045.04.1.1 TaxID=2493673 RepID=UPI000F76342E|nr:hypothetical protein [Mesorhizobium sp. M1B.F.Ca.ET.045.04.1.1]AZO29305.1 hypothetical protein EJ071_19255 [Mesorhizobium sp. M1B.F.Ca.ET.045.04.1.1]